MNERTNVSGGQCECHCIKEDLGLSTILPNYERKISLGGYADRNTCQQECHRTPLRASSDATAEEAGEIQKARLHYLFDRCGNKGLWDL